MSPWMYFGSVAILVIIVVTFVGGPILSGTGAAGSGLTFGSYAGEDISYIPGNYLSRQRDVIAERVNDSGTNTNLEWVAYQVWRGAFQSTVIHTAILNDAERSGLRFADETIDQALTSYAGYFENGEFSAERYRETPNQEKASIRKFYREELIHNQYMSDIIYGVKVSSATEDFIREMASPERSFNFLKIGFDAFPEDAVWQYAEENSDLFQKINLSRVTIRSSEENALAVHQQLSGDPALFEEVARTQSKDAYAEGGGYIGWQYFYSLSSELESEDEAMAVFGLTAGDVSDVFETPFGWVIYKVNEDSVSASRENDDDLETVRSYMERFERGTIEDYLIGQASAIRSQAAENGLLAASDSDWEYGQTASFPLNYGNIEILKPVQGIEQSGALEGAAFNEALLTALFSIDEGEITEPQVLDDGVLLFEVETVVQPEEQTLEMVGLYYSYLAQQYAESDLRTAILTSDKLEDNFDAVFTKYFLSE